MKNDKKLTESMHLHWIDAQMKRVDDWYIRRQDGIYVADFFYPQVHQTWLRDFDHNRRQYEFHCVVATPEEAEIISRWQRRRARLQSQEIPVKPTDHIKISDQQLQYITLKQKGRTNEEIAETTHCSVDNIKQFFSRKSRACGVKGAIAFIEYLKMIGKI